ncbi:MAG TPA: PBP1A family penicillin-binding protein [Pseudomonadota bacterium]|nr:PBP1A family penicillin-binding protein [Pseudomonadota bacterium]
MAKRSTDKSSRSGLSLPGQSRRAAHIYRIVRTVILLALLGVCLSMIAVGSIFLYYTSDPSLPTIDTISDYHPKVSTRVLASDGRLIGEIFEERRTVVPRERIPRVIVDAFVDAEDAQFFEHHGLNYVGMVRAVLQSLVQARHLRGASTLTQQLVKTYVLKSNERSLKRKVQEMYLSLRLEKKLSKEEILWLYLTQIYFGHGRYGIEEAARFYFGKSVTDVNPGEAALLASLPKGPEEISPRRNPERAKLRQRYVLSQMARYHHISDAEALKYAEAPILLTAEPQPMGLFAPEYVEEVEKILVEKYGQEKLPYLGLNVRTACNVEVQRAARLALEQGLVRIDERNGYRKGVRNPSASDRKKHLEELKKEFPSGPPMGRVVEGVVTKVLDGEKNGGWAMVDLGAVVGNLPLPQVGDRYNPKGIAATQRYSEGDVVKVRVGRIGKEGPMLVLDAGPQGAVVVMDPETRQVMAMIGGYGYLRGSFNRVLRAKRQPGSAFKPFVFATAFESRRYTAASVLNDSPQVYDLPDLKAWAPKNAGAHNTTFMGPVRLRIALAQSLNTVASQLMYDLKPPPVAAMAKSLGIESPLEETYALALGASVVTPLELTNAYATLAAKGRRGDPLWILQVGTEPPQQSDLHQAVTPDLAFLLSHVMQSVIEEGTAVGIKGKLRRPAAGKTGTTNANRDAWFVGYTPDVVAGVWVGFDDSRSLGEKEQGARSALPIWLDVMQVAVKDKRVQNFVQPASVVIQNIDPVSGKLPAPGAPSIEEVFLAGTEPTEQAPAPGETSAATWNMNQD